MRLSSAARARFGVTVTLESAEGFLTKDYADYADIFYPCPSVPSVVSFPVPWRGRPSRLTRRDLAGDEKNG